jgi:hypothetical protein
MDVMGVTNVRNEGNSTWIKGSFGRQAFEKFVISRFTVL